MTGTHKRNTDPMRASPRCGAKTRRGTPCQAPAVSGKAQCRMHGGANGSGAPHGNQNAFKHGLHTEEAREMRRLIRELSRNTNDIIEKM